MADAVARANHLFLLPDRCFLLRNAAPPFAWPASMPSRLCVQSGITDKQIRSQNCVRVARRPLRQLHRWVPPDELAISRQTAVSTSGTATSRPWHKRETFCPRQPAWSSCGIRFYTVSTEAGVESMDCTRSRRQRHAYKWALRMQLCRETGCECAGNAAIGSKAQR